MLTVCALALPGLSQPPHSPPPTPPRADSRLSTAHMAADPGFARAQCKLLRMHAQDEQALELAAEV